MSELYPLTLKELLTPLTEEQVEASMYAVLDAIGVSTTSWKDGSPLRTLLTADAIIQAAFSLLQSDVAMSGFLDFATGDWLVIVARYGYGVEVDQASFATGQLILMNAGGGIYDLDPGDYIALNPSTNKTYRNRDTFHLGAGSSVTIDIIAEEAGSLSTSIPDAINDSVTPLVGVTLRNPFAIVGTDKESDPSVRTKCRQKLGSLSPNGPWDAYSYAARIALRPTDNSKVGVTRTRITKDGFGNLTLYCATATGGLSDDDVAAVDVYVQRRAAPLAVTATTASAEVFGIPVTYELWMYNTTGYTEQQIKDMVAERLAKYFSLTPIGGNQETLADSGRVFAEGIRSAIASTFNGVGDQQIIFNVLLTFPLGDVALTVSQIPELATVSGIINQVAPSAGY